MSFLAIFDLVHAVLESGHILRKGYEAFEVLC